MSNLVEHAKSELRILGYTGEEPKDDPDRWMYDHILGMVEKFAEEGHSGSSASYAIHVLDKLLQFQNLTPLTNNPEEWMDHSEVWQSRRRSEAFSKNGGQTYYLLSECRRGWRRKVFGPYKMHKSEEYKA